MPKTLAGEDIEKNQPCYLASDGKAYCMTALTRAQVAAFQGFSIVDVAEGSPIRVYPNNALIKGLSGLTANVEHFLSLSGPVLIDSLDQGVWTCSVGIPVNTTVLRYTRGSLLPSVADTPVWDYTETFNLVTGQADYLWGAGTQRSGDITAGARTDALSALVQWGVATLLPGLDYVVLADRLRLLNTPSAEQAASGQPLIVRVRRASV